MSNKATYTISGPTPHAPEEPTMIRIKKLIPIKGKRYNRRGVIFLIITLMAFPTLTAANDNVEDYKDLVHYSKGQAEARSVTQGDNYILFEKCGFTYLHVEGSPNEIGTTHGEVLADMIERAISAYAHLTEDRYDMNWRECRLHAANFWAYVPQEQKEEIEGIAQGAATKNALNPLGSTVDWLDILTLNCMWDLWWRVDGVGKRLPFPFLGEEEENPMPFPEGNIHHCSAFVATGSATADGKFVIAQNLWMPFYLSPSFAIFIDIVPETGNRILMEVTAGMIWSGTEWYLNGAGMVIGETTLGGGPYNWGNVPSFVRLRKAVQYSDSIDEFKDIMLTDTNGAYCGDYLLGDAKTNEVAILELGSSEYELARTTDGFLGSCNYPWDPEVAAEMNEIQGWDHGCYPRYVRLNQLYEQYNGKIDIEIGKKILSDHYDTVEETINPCGHTLCGHVENESGYPWGSLDGKVTNQTLAARFETWARFGHSCGQPFKVADHRKEHPEYAFDDLVDIIPGPWCTFGPLEEVEVNVVDTSGEPIGGAEILITSREDGWSYNGTTDEQGKMILKNIMHSKYYFNATKEKKIGSLVSVVTESGMVTITLDKNIEKNSSGMSKGSILVIIIVLAVICAAVVLVRIKKFKTKEKS